MNDPENIGEAIQKHKIEHGCTVLEAADAVFTTIEQDRLALCPAPGLRDGSPMAESYRESPPEKAAGEGVSSNDYPPEYMD